MASPLDTVMRALGKAVIAMTPQHQLGAYTTNIADATTVTAVAAFNTEGFSRITGLVKSNAALTCYVYQGTGQDDADMEYVTSVTVPGSATEGAGAAFSVEIVGQRARITLNNASGGATTSLQSAFYLRGI